MATACIAQITFGFEPKGKPVVAVFDTPHAVPAAPAGGGVRGWGRDGLGRGARGRGARALRALMWTTRRRSRRRSLQ